VAHLDALICPSATSARLHARFAPLTRVERLAHFLPDPEEGGGAGEGPRAGVGVGEGPRAGVGVGEGPRVGEGAGTGKGARPFFLYAGRLESVKGVDALLRAFRNRRSEDLLIAGEGTLEAELRAQAADLSHVRFLGWQSPADLDALYRAALAVLVPTAGHESFGLVAVEAFARATPVVARGFGALAELLEDSGGGLPFRTDAELEAALARITAEPALRKELGGAGRAAYEARYTESAHVIAYLRLVAELAEGRREGEVAALARAGAERESAAA
jgi:glycosyltransferase involved in cell wall biosynthesis